MEANITAFMLISASQQNYKFLFMIPKANFYHLSWITAKFFKQKHLVEANENVYQEKVVVVAVGGNRMFYWSRVVVDQPFRQTPTIEWLKNFLVPPQLFLFVSQCRTFSSKPVTQVRALDCSQPGWVDQGFFWTLIL